MPDVTLHHIADRYHVSFAAVEEIHAALFRTNGMFAQFNHPELGGRGQWMPGMCQIGDMSNDQLRAQVGGLCAELSAIVKGIESQADGALAAAPMADATDRAAGPVGSSWWPASLGEPNATGDQNGIRYAYFTDHRRLAVQFGGRVTVYNTGRHRISGVSQQQGSSTSLHFTSQLGDVALDSLRVVTH